MVKIVAGVEGAVAEELESGAVVFIGTAFADNGHLAAHGHAVFRGE